MTDLGISRVTDITRMDRLGLPVSASVRPRGTTLRVHAGKGIRPEEARVGALMEAIEYAVAERSSALALTARMSLRDLAGQLPSGIRLIDLAPRLGVHVAPEREILAIECESIGRTRRVFLPAELVLMPCPKEGADFLFGWSTNGLASGNSLDEATLHGLLEVLERDALAMNRGRNASVRVDNDELPEAFRTWAAQWDRLGVELVVRHLPNDFDLPCFEAHLHEAASPDVNLARGSGLHLDRDIALARAVCEAAQSRLSFIHGGRDDITRFYERQAADGAVNRDAQADMISRIKGCERQAAYASLPDESGLVETPTKALKALLARLTARGFGDVMRRRMTLGDEGIDLHGLHVVKVIVPRCESTEGGVARMGARLFGRILQGA